MSHLGVKIKHTEWNCPTQKFPQKMTKEDKHSNLPDLYHKLSDSWSYVFVARQTWEMRRVVGKVHREVVRADFFWLCRKWYSMPKMVSGFHCNFPRNPKEVIYYSSFIISKCQNHTLLRMSICHWVGLA